MLAYACLLNSQSVVLFGDVLQKRRVYVLAKRHFLDAFNVSSVHGRPQEDQFLSIGKPDIEHLNDRIAGERSGKLWMQLRNLFKCQITPAVSMSSRRSIMSSAIAKDKFAIRSL